MKEKVVEMMVNFIVRLVFGATMIWFINMFLESQHIAGTVGINLLTLLTSGILGVPGVALLYGIVLMEIL